MPRVTFISDCLAAKTAQNKEKSAEKGIKEGIIQIKIVILQPEGCVLGGRNSL